MDWGNFIFLFAIIIIGYTPYKFILKKRPNGLRGIPERLAVFLTLWFITFSAILLFRITGFQINSSFWILTVFSLTTLIWVIAPFAVPKIGIHPKKLLEASQKLYTLELNPWTYYMKYFEVVFQQVKFLFLIEVVLINMTPNYRILWFTALLVLIHLGNLFFLPKREALMFTALSLPMAMVFGILINNGLILLTASIHLWFYIIYSCLPWFNNKTHKPILTNN